jgi:histidyl-tRNA synthetase
MYAARAGSLPKPTKWFTTGGFFRAERPQRGRLREFLQWNCDVIGCDDNDDAKAIADAEVAACAIDLFVSLGLTKENIRVHYSHRAFADFLLTRLGMDPAKTSEGVSLIDRAKKVDEGVFVQEFERLGGAADAGKRLFLYLRHPNPGKTLGEQLGIEIPAESIPAGLTAFQRELAALGIESWTRFDPAIARGLAYYTGRVFEVIVDGERAVAGGGRYDNLIELFGGPPTPAVGFGMGDVVLSLVLQDKGLMPSDAELMEHAGQRPDVFVISNGTPEADGVVAGVVAELRRGTGRGGSGLHARRSYKATKNIGKLLKDAAACGARFAVILESATEATLKNMATNEQDTSRTAISALGAELRRRLGRAEAVGRLV